MSAKTAKKTQSFPLRLSDEDGELVKAAADRAGLSVSAFLRLSGLFCADYVDRTGTLPLKPKQHAITRDAEAHAKTSIEERAE